MKKIKVTLEMDPKNKRLRGQSVYTLILKSTEKVEQILERLNEEGEFKKYILELSFHAKQMNILGVQSF